MHVPRQVNIGPMLAKMALAAAEELVGGVIRHCGVEIDLVLIAQPANEPAEGDVMLVSLVNDRSKTRRMLERGYERVISEEPDLRGMAEISP